MGALRGIDVQLRAVPRPATPPGVSLSGVQTQKEEKRPRLGLLHGAAAMAGRLVWTAAFCAVEPGPGTMLWSVEIRREQCSTN